MCGEFDIQPRAILSFSSLFHLFLNTRNPMKYGGIANIAVINQCLILLIMVRIFGIVLYGWIGEEIPKGKYTIYFNGEAPWERQRCNAVC